MHAARSLLGPKSKYDKSLPYTYEAWVDALSGRGSEPFNHAYFSDTLCGLIECLEDSDVRPDEAQLFAVYRKGLIPLEISWCTTADGAWLNRPEICRSLESHYRDTLDAHYKGHVEKGSCSFEDRNRMGIGPF